MRYVIESRTSWFGEADEFDVAQQILAHMVASYGCFHGIIYIRMVLS